MQLAISQLFVICLEQGKSRKEKKRKENEQMRYHKIVKREEGGGDLFISVSYNRKFTSVTRICTSID